MSLITKNKIGFIDGSLPPPPPDDPRSAVWKQCDTMVTSWLLHSIAKPIAQSVLWIGTARNVWLDIKDRYSNVDSFCWSDLLEKINDVKQKGTTVTEYFTHLKILWDEMSVIKPIPRCTCIPSCHCDLIPTIVSNSESEYVIRFLKGLDEQFAPVKSQVMLMTPLPHIKTAFGMALKLERQLGYSAQSLPSDPTVMLNTSKVFENMSNRAPVNKSANSNYQGMRYSQYTGKRPQCTFCGIPGHIEDKCYKKHRYPPGYTFRPRANMVENMDTDCQMETMSNVYVPQITKQEYDQLRSLLKGKAVVVDDALDSKHLVNQATVMSASFLQDTNKEVQNVNVTLPNGNTVVVSHIVFSTGQEHWDDDWIS